MPRTDWGWLITAEELRSWILHEDADLLVVNKPGLVVCHPSKHGPWSSLVGAAREYLGVEQLHMPSRLDRETSGVVLLAKTREMGSRLQRAVQARRVRKIYHALLCGEMREPVVVDQPLGPHPSSRIWIRQAVVDGGSAARTEFRPLRWGGGYTLAEIEPATGRLHQIRVHAAWLGHPVAGDKIYGPDESLFLEFLEQGWTARLSAALRLEHQALHASLWSFGAWRFEAPLPEGWNGMLERPEGG
jgi:23S rRNA pseudouridine1911/1915/1917 synthase